MKSKRERRRVCGNTRSGSIDIQTHISQDRKRFVCSLLPFKTFRCNLKFPPRYNCSLWRDFRLKNISSRLCESDLQTVKKHRQWRYSSIYRDKLRGIFKFCIFRPLLFINLVWIIWLRPSLTWPTGSHRECLFSYLCCYDYNSDEAH